MNNMIIDLAFPHIQKALDMALLAKLFQAHLYSSKSGAICGSIEIVSCTISYKQHKVGKKFVAAYKLVLLDTLTGLHREQLVGAKLC